MAEKKLSPKARLIKSLEIRAKNLAQKITNKEIAFRAEKKELEEEWELLAIQLKALKK